jgi:hypothetical protein
MRQTLPSNRGLVTAHIHEGHFYFPFPFSSCERFLSPRNADNNLDHTLFTELKTVCFSDYVHFHYVRRRVPLYRNNDANVSV